MHNSYRKLQYASSISLIVIAVLLLVITVKMFFPTSPSITFANASRPNQAMPVSNVNSRPANEPAQITPVGKTVPMENIDWKSGKKTLIMYVSTTCHFCNESSPFYKRLVEKYSDGKNIRLVAVMPQPVEEARTHLKNLGVNIQDVYSSPLSSIGVTATPTLLLVDQNGVVSETWRGKLTSDRETEVLNKLAS